MDIDVYGLGIGIQFDDPVVLERLPSHLPPGWKPLNTSRIDRRYSVRSTPRENSGGLKRYVLQQGPHPLVETKDLAYALDLLERDLELYVAECAPRYVFVHAGVVGWRGKAILIPGRSYSGKSSLVAALCHAGATYYSDEYALINPQGLVAPYPRALHLRKAIPNVPARNGERGQPFVDLEPLPIDLVVLTRFEANTVWQPRSLPAGHALLELMANTMSAQRQPQKVLGTLRRALSTAHALRGARAEAADIASLLLQTVEAGR